MTDKVEKPKAKRYATPLAHPSYVVEPCPRCGFPEADGGYCPDCGNIVHFPGCNCPEARKKPR